MGFSSCGPRALEYRLGSCGAWASLPLRMWGLPGPGIESVSPADRVLTAGPPRKSRRTWFQCLLAVSHWFVGQDPACSPLSLKLKNHVHLTLSSVMSPKLLRFRISRIKLMIQTYTCSSGFSDLLSVHSCNPESSNLLYFPSVFSSSLSPVTTTFQISPACIHCSPLTTPAPELL